MSRPEHIAPPDLFYDKAEAQKYAANTRMLAIQKSMSERAVELLQLPGNKSCYLLDIGCGSGLSGEVLSEAGHVWMGVDISTAMLGVALEREVDGDLAVNDMGDGLPFRPGSFDGAVSISALQWLCNADKKAHEPKKRASRFFHSLYSCLTRGAKAVFQFYPETPEQMEMLSTAAMKAGFSGGVVVDFPNSRLAKKYFLVLFAGEPNAKTKWQTVKGLDHALGADAPQTYDDDQRASGSRSGSKGLRAASASAAGAAAAGAGAGAFGAAAAAAAGPGFAAAGFGSAAFEFASAQPAAAAAAGAPKQETVLFTAAEPQRLGPRPKGGQRQGVKSRDWVKQKKDKQRKAGKVVAPDSKYTARKRRPKF